LAKAVWGWSIKARDQRLDRFVCIKILHPGQVQDESRKQRFIQEALIDDPPRRQTPRSATIRNILRVGP
jgi:hypothetical protein